MIRIDPQERATGALAGSKTMAAIGELEQRGFVVLERALEPDHVQSLHDAYVALLAEKMKRFGIAPESDYMSSSIEDISAFIPKGGNHDYNRWNMHLPSRSPLFDPAVFSNSFGMPIVEGILGRDCVLETASSDTCLPKSGYQAIHQDGIRCLVTVNIPLIDVGREHGPLALWPGTHSPRRNDGTIAFSREPHAVEHAEQVAIADGIPSENITVPAGSLIIRDTRLLHRGTPNHSDVARPMLSLIYGVAPTAVPYHVLTRGAARSARIVRDRARARSGVSGRAMLNIGNRLGAMVESVACSDRLGKRRLTQTLWSSLPERAQRLLAFAEIDGLTSPEYERRRTVTAAYPFLHESIKLAMEWRRLLR